MKKLIKRTMGAALIGAALTVSGCDLDLQNPNAPTQEQALNTADGLILQGVGLQAQYAGNINTFIRAPALVTDELGTRSIALLADRSLVGDGEISSDYGVVSGPYAAAFRTVRVANDLLRATPNPSVNLGQGTRTGIIALAKLFKAMALGTILEQYEQIPVDADPNGAPLRPRQEVFDTVIGLLQSAQADVARVSAADLAGFRTRVLDPGLDLRNTIDAMLARFSLFRARELAGAAANPVYQQAIAAAMRVDTTVYSTFTYPGTDINPVYNYSFAAQYTAARQSFVNEAEAGDRRPAFWVNVTGTPPPANPARIALRPLLRYSGRNDPFPVYLPGEMILIQAEAYARLGNLDRARELINVVRTDCAGPTLEPLACLPPLTAAQLPTQEAILRQIAYERRYELYLQGLRWDDSRQLPGTVTPVIRFLPFPLAECQTNPSIPGPCV